MKKASSANELDSSGGRAALRQNNPFNPFIAASPPGGSPRESVSSERTESPPLISLESSTESLPRGVGHTALHSPQGGSMGMPEVSAKPRGVGPHAPKSTQREVDLLGEPVAMQSPSKRTGWASAAPHDEGDPLWKKMQERESQSQGAAVLAQSQPVESPAAGTNPFLSSGEDDDSDERGSGSGSRGDFGEGGDFFVDDGADSFGGSDTIAFTGLPDDDWAAGTDEHPGSDGAKPGRSKMKTRGLKTRAGAASAAARQKAANMKESTAFENAKARSAAAKEKIGQVQFKELEWACCLLLVAND
jgi:hypothetical protein